MNIFSQRIQSWMVAMISMLTWIVILSFMLSFLFDAGISGGWIIAGLLISCAAFGGLLVTKELTDAILSPEFTRLGEKLAVWKPSVQTPQRVRMSSFSSCGFLMDPEFAENRRITLGLCTPAMSHNRRRRASR